MVAGTLLGLGVHRLRSRTPAPEALDAARTLVVYNAISGDLSVLDAPSAPATAARTLPCVHLHRWSLRVGTHDDHLVTLDSQDPAIELVSLRMLRRIADGREPCVAGQNRVARRVAIASRRVPYMGLLVGSRLYVSDFSANVIEVYDWVAGTANEPPDLRFEREIRFPAARNLGLSDMAARGETLLVAANGYFCFERDCPSGRLAESHLFFVPLGETGTGPFPEARPANLNGAGLYTHAPTEAPYVISAGDFGGGYSSLQRVLPDRTLGPEITLLRNAAAKSAFALTDDTFIVLQFSGEHVFLVDARRDRLRRILRFDGAAFVDVPLDTAALPDRASADFQDLLADPGSSGRFYLIDAKGERLLHLRTDNAGSTLEVVRVTVLRTEAYRSFPRWGFWLDGEGR